MPIKTDKIITTADGEKLSKKVKLDLEVDTSIKDLVQMCDMVHGFASSNT